MAASSSSNPATGAGRRRWVPAPPLKAVPGRRYRTLQDGTDPLGDIPFKLLDPKSDMSIQCDGCGKWLPVHSEIIAVYGGAQNIPFFCSMVGLKRCHEEPADIDDITYLKDTVKSMKRKRNGRKRAE